MKLDEFVSQVLQNIENGLTEAKNKTDKTYFIQTSNDGGVNFDVAVTTLKGDRYDIQGKMKVGIIEVLGAGVEANLGENTEKTEVSRIRFTVYVPSQTENEDKAYYAMVREQNEQRGHDLEEM